MREREKKKKNSREKKLFNAAKKQRQVLEKNICCCCCCCCRFCCRCLCCCYCWNSLTFWHFLCSRYFLDLVGFAQNEFCQKFFLRLISLFAQQLFLSWARLHLCVGDLKRIFNFFHSEWMINCMKQLRWDSNLHPSLQKILWNKTHKASKAAASVLYSRQLHYIAIPIV